MISDFDLKYMGRSYARIDMMREMIKKWGLVGKNLVLDVGCGFRAWTHVLGEENNR